jgi:hypothetical protein
VRVQGVRWGGREGERWAIKREMNFFFQLKTLSVENKKVIFD